MKRRITVTTGSRAEYGILKPILYAINSNKKLELCLIVTGTHLFKKYGLTINEIKYDGFKIATTVSMNLKADSSYSISKTLGSSIIKFSKIFRKIKPDINLVLGDRDEMLASAMAAYHMNIPNAHIHGGDKSGGIDEYTRHAITKISNIHFAATKKSMDRIIKMGENPKFVYLTGSPSIDEIVNNKISSRQELEKKYKIKIHGNEILLLQHPVTTQIHKTEEQILAILKAITKIKKPTIIIAPNSDAENKKIFEHITSFSKKYRFIRMYRNVPRNDYLAMLKNFGVLVGNSSSGIIEASYFNIPVVNIGIRQEGREMGKNIINVPTVKMIIVKRAIVKALKNKKYRKTSRDYIYGTGNATKKIVHILEQIKLDKKLIQKQISY